MIKYNQNGGEILTGMIPIYGTWQDYKTFREKPTLENFGWMAGQEMPYFLLAQGRVLKALNTTRKAKKLIQAKRA